MLHSALARASKDAKENPPSPLDSIARPIRKGQKKRIFPSAFDAVSANAKRRVETHLSNKRDELSEMGRLLVRIDLENLADAVIMVPLLKKLLFVACWVPLDEVL